MPARRSFIHEMSCRSTCRKQRAAEVVCRTAASGRLTYLEETSYSCRARHNIYLESMLQQIQVQVLC